MVAFHFEQLFSHNFFLICCSHENIDNCHFKFGYKIGFVYLEKKHLSHVDLVADSIQN